MHNIDVDEDEEVILTGNPEIDINILLNLDIKSLSKFCSTSKYVQDFCSDDYFWQKKFGRDSLPLAAIIITPMNSNDWIKEYNLTQQAQLIVANIMVINIVEKTKSVDKTRGRIIAIIQEYNIFLDMLPDILREDVINIIGDKDYYFRVDLDHINDNSYKVTIFIYTDTNKVLQPILERQWNYQEAVKFLTIVIRRVSPGGPVNITDDYYLSLYMSQNLLDSLSQRVPRLVEANIRILLKRVAMWEILEHLEPK